MQSVTFRNRTLTLPKSFESFLRRGNEFILFKSDDELLFKQVRNLDIRQRALRPSRTAPMTMEEIDTIVHDVRRRPAKKR